MLGERLCMCNDNYDVTVYFKEEKTSEVHIRNGKVTFENFIDNPLWLPFGIKTEATMNDLEDFYEERCFPKERGNCKDILNALDVPCYEPELICRKTHGQQFDDFLWLQFSDEPQVQYKDIALRN